MHNANHTPTDSCDGCTDQHAPGTVEKYGKERLCPSCTRQRMHAEGGQDHDERDDR